MAKVTITALVDDLDNGIQTDVETVAFHLKGQEYRIDLGPANREKLEIATRILEEAESALEPFARKSRPVVKLSQTSGPKRKVSAAGSGNAGKVRAWALANEIEVPSRGRIPGSVREAYEAAQRGETAPRQADPAGNAVAFALAAIQARASGSVPVAS